MPNRYPPQMNAPSEKAPIAWQPITVRGVAAFARATWGRLLLVQFLCALAAATAVGWFLAIAWFPAVTEAIHQLPPAGEVRSGRLDWHGESPQRLAEGHFLAFAVDLKHEGEARSPAHLQVEFGETDFKIFSLLGFVQHTYPPGWIVAFNRGEMEPAWGAWKPPVLAIVALLVIAGLMSSWVVLGTLYCLIVWLFGVFSNRDLNLGRSWRLAGAALMPGTLFLTGAIVLYGLGALDLVRLSVIAALHIVIGWFYLIAGALCLPRHPEAPAMKANPFIES
jgi:hypothetical protein